ncbi:RNA polymerase sigma factor [Sphingobacterium paludis]|uniref:RNA polymerase sigma-70 factor (ECF subfamily) n=1 Tax=Sphingobacterium paludis TaxID=1476465 RepID=A0A4R7CVI1_9SPHI|nr:sigma-70 family RNA polymerase sigma factor [Sphingobacterium paludis]TDS12180.1 RNA polymerase sigma-70 factor (ECF subfamily) [Sphingobacterium paludis]
MKDIHQLSDIALLSLMGNGDAEAFYHLFLRYNKSLYTTAYMKLNDEEEAKDVVQDVFANLWHKREAIAIRNGQLAPYLYAAIRYRVLDIIAKKKNASDHIRSLHVFLQHCEDHTDHAVRENMLLTIIKQQISLLPNRMQQIFLLSRYDHLSHKEIAQRLDIAESTVTDQVKKAMKILRSKLRHLFLLLFFIRFF